MIPLVFLPAMPCDGRMYQAQMTALSDLVTPQVMILAEDSVAKSAKRVLNSLDGKFVLAGTAYGGCLALEIAVRAPTRIAGLWLMNCSPGPHPDHASVRRTSARIRRGEHQAVLQEFADTAIPDSDPISRATFVQMGLDVGADIFARQSDAALTRQGRWLDLPSLNIPTLLVWGAADKFVPTDTAARMARALPDVQVEILDGCGHFPTLERPIETAKIARHWLQSRFCMNGQQ